jgi:ribosome-associated heat shock protein Hsp15
MTEGAGAMRIDKLLWFLRLARTRSAAQAMAASGHLRINGRRVERAHQKVVAGDCLTVPVHGAVRVLRIGNLPQRRGCATEARACYEELDAQGEKPIAALSEPNLERGFLQS